MKPNVVEEIERYSIDETEIKDLILTGFMHTVFLGGQPGDGQKVEIGFSLGHLPTATIVITTLKQAYKERD